MTGIELGVLGSLMTGLSGAVGAVGAYQGQQHQAQQAKNAATTAKIQADQIDTSHRDDLTAMLENIRVIRASTGAASLSPTGLALEEDQKKISDRNRTRDVANKNMQAKQLESDTKYLRSSANAALFGGVAKSLPSFFGD